jgi:HEAT repeat protein
VVVVKSVIGAEASINGTVSVKVKLATQVKRRVPSAEAALSKLAAVLGDRAPGVRHRARLRLIAGGPASVPYLMSALESPRQEARWEAAKCLQAIADVRAAPALVERLADRDPDVCWVAAEALVALGPKALAPLMHGLIAYNNVNAVRRATAGTAGSALPA